MKKIPVLHPFLFAVYPTLFLFSHNIAQVSLSQTWVPIIITLGFTIIMLLLVIPIFKNMEKVGIIVSLFLTLFFSYGHIINIINQWKIGNPVYLLLIECIIFVFCFYFIRKTQISLHNFTNILTVVVSLLIAFQLVNIGAFGFKTGFFRQDNKKMGNIGANPMKSGKTATLPNIYYIILDAYARQDVLKKTFDYNNEKFINYLVRRGFYVADKSVANYSYTQPSLASSLNFTYLDDWAKSVGIKNTDYYPLLKITWNNRTARFLEQHGYKTIFIYTAGTGLEGSKETAFYTLERAHRWLANAFHETVLYSTPIPYIFKDISGKVFDEFDFHRRQVLYAFDKVEDLSSKEGPLFIFAHIIKPHLPFVFSETGDPISPHYQYGLWYTVEQGMDQDEYLDLYKKQLTFINRKVMLMVEAILSNSSKPPIIILQSDHGPTLDYYHNSLTKTNIKLRFPILNAYYLPNGGETYLYPTITPVNTFRIILNHYFNMKQIDLLPDKSYYASFKYPYRYYNVTEKLEERIN